MNQDKQIKKLGVAEFYFPGYWSGKLKIKDKNLIAIISILIIILAEELKES